ncbi:LLM class flavin-dependent oxidoreductase [Actinacidiphila glaucinigra]|uniref:LLM class flavin-dependent oxidoreductase n=1 Tax=Actinacidiphila glaucinigra TaxID=235986 RepID=UPI00371F2A56
MPPVSHHDIHGRSQGDAPVPLSVLDLLPIGAGQSAADAVRTNVALARLAESRGYHRLWIAEHHNSPAMASSSPAVLLAHLAAHTSTLRLGSGGIMLPNFAPLVVAEQFGTLNALIPGRVDLGVGRAFGTSKGAAAALRRDGRPQEGNDFPTQVDELIRYLDGEVPDVWRDVDARAVPGPHRPGGGPGQRPPLWILGSSVGSARMAASLGLPYAYAHHIAPEDTRECLAAYRESFLASDWLTRPYVAVALTAFAAEDRRRALAQLLTGALATLWWQRGRLEPLPTPEEAAAHPLTDEDKSALAAALRHAVFGTPEEVRAGIDAFVEDTGADEVLLTSLVHGTGARLRSYELIADAYGFPKEREETR